jgi:acyl carrier protein
MKSKKSLAKEIRDIFKKQLGIKVSLNDKIYAHKQWDSIGNFTVLLECEKHFNIKFSSNDFNNINSFKEILNIVDKKFR